MNQMAGLTRYPHLSPPSQVTHVLPEHLQRGKRRVKEPRSAVTLEHSLEFAEPNVCDCSRASHHLDEAEQVKLPIVEDHVRSTHLRPKHQARSLDAGLIDVPSAGLCIARIQDMSAAEKAGLEVLEDSDQQFVVWAWTKDDVLVLDPHGNTFSRSALVTYALQKGR